MKLLLAERGFRCTYILVCQKMIMRHLNLGKDPYPSNEEHSYTPICGMLTKQSPENCQISMSQSGKK